MQKPATETGTGNGGAPLTGTRQALTRLSFTALFAALIASGAFVAIPIGPVPVVLQNFFTLLAGLVLGPFLGGASVALFLAAGAIGAPVFANNGSPMGIARLLGPTGGYLLGYLLGALAAGVIAGLPRPGRVLPWWRLALAALTGIAVGYVPGLLRLKMVLNAEWPRVLLAGLYPFLPGDILKGIAAVLAAPRLRRAAASLLSR
jgi:biotin transport system substrate-specific component